MRNPPNNFFNKSAGNIPARCAPRKLTIIPVIPNRIISFQFAPRLKNSIFQISPNQCTIPTKRSVSVSGYCKERVGTRIVDVPKPVVVPTVEEINVRIKTYRFSTNPLYVNFYEAGTVVAICIFSTCVFFSVLKFMV
jgi:hypothetical protein